ncbi:MAG: S-layer homology domain-containing protein [Lachnospiraceae bacterium]|nr:S-layer homology domain-containing protein [Lachnospiraceae bacterium]
MKKKVFNFRFVLMLSVIILLAGVIMPSGKVSADEPEALNQEIRSIDLMKYRNPLDTSTIFLAPDELEEWKYEIEDALGTSEADLKARVYQAMLAREEIIEIREYDIHDHDVFDRIFSELTVEHPEILYSEPRCGTLWFYNNTNGTVTYTKMEIIYGLSAEEALQLQNACERAFSELNPSWSNERKLLYLHDYLVTHCQYDGTFSYYDAYSAMVRHSSVCQGYASAFVLLARVQGFEVNMVTSDYLNHAWNLITLDGVEYYVDCTWDDPWGDTESYCGHTNFLRSRDGMIDTGHTEGEDASGNDAYADDWEIDGEYVFYTRGLNSIKYDGYYWNKIRHFIVEKNGIQAYIHDYEGEDPNWYNYEKYFYIRQNDGSERYYNAPAEMKWYVWGGSGAYVGNFGNFAKVGNQLYLSTPKAIYQVGTDGSTSLYYSLSTNELSVGYIYGLLGDGNKLYYYLEKAPFDGQYTKKTLTIQAGQIPISDCTVTVAAQSYTGSPITPQVTVKYDGATLIQGTDYTVSYSNNINAGTATVTVTGAGNYVGTTTATFSIAAKSVNGLTISSIGDYTYNGLAIIPDITVKDGNKLLTENKDYSIEYFDNINTGTATVTITGKGNYSGSRNETFNILAKSISGTDIDSISDKTYSGSAITPNVTIYDGTNLLAKGTDYTVSYSNNVNAGMATITITGIGNYIGTATVSFKINAKSLANLFVDAISSQVYTGSAITPTVTVKDGNKTLVKGTDYTVAYSDNINPGTATVTITGKGNYTGTRTTHFSITQDIKSIQDVTVLEIPDQTYTGEAIKPSLTIKDGNRVLTKGTDYSVAYFSNTNVGVASIYIGGMGAYTGSRYVYFNIVPKSVSGLTISSISDQTYDGFAISPVITVSDGSKVLSKGTDYIVSYSNNVNVGTATATITGKGNYTGTRKVTYKIVAKAIINATIDSIGDQTYTGSAITPAVTVRDGSKTLTKGTDYTVAYSNNTNVGTATVTVTGKGNYTGSKSTTFKIVKTAKNVSELTVDAISNHTYTGSAITPALTIKDGSTALVKGTDYTVSYSNNVNVGTATATITGKGNYTGTRKVTFKIVAKAISKATIDSIPDQKFTGSAITPEVTVKDGSKTLTKGTDYTVAYSNNTNVGTATVKITGKGNYTGSKSTTFKIVNKSVADEFDDIDGTEWFVPYIQFVYDHGIMSGKGRNFDPNGKIKREELTQIIYSHAGKPAVSSNTENPFSDVPSGAWYCNGILWCSKNGIVGGVGNGKFGVGQNVTREDFALMLYKYAQVCKMDSVNNIDENAYKGYKDSDKVSKYAIKAMNWAITNGIMGGKGKSGSPKSELSLDSKGNATRAEGATMIMKFMGDN